MKRSSVVAPLVVGLLLCGPACQRPAQRPGASMSANVTNTSGGAQADAQPPAAPRTQTLDSLGTRQEARAFLSDSPAVSYCGLTATPCL
jgi:hypothetical protein